MHVGEKIADIGFLCGSSLLPRHRRQSEVSIPFFFSQKKCTLCTREEDKRWVLACFLPHLCIAWVRLTINQNRKEITKKILSDALYNELFASDLV